MIDDSERFGSLLDEMRGSMEEAVRNNSAENLDPHQTQRQLSAMAQSDPTRDEIDAKIAAAEARTDAKFERLSGKLDRVLAAIEGFQRDLGETRRQVSDTGKATEEATNGTRRTVRNTIVATVLPTAIVVFLGLGALIVGIGQMNLSHIANLIGLFSALGGSPAP